jgi:hypothetical protein
LTPLHYKITARLRLLDLSFSTNIHEAEFSSYSDLCQEATTYPRHIFLGLIMSSNSWQSAEGSQYTPSASPSSSNASTPASTNHRRSTSMTSVESELAKFDALVPFETFTGIAVPDLGR